MYRSVLFLRNHRLSYTSTIAPVAYLFGLEVSIDNCEQITLSTSWGNRCRYFYRPDRRLHRNMIDALTTNSTQWDLPLTDSRKSIHALIGETPHVIDQFNLTHLRGISVPWIKTNLTELGSIGFLMGSCDHSKRKDKKKERKQREKVTEKKDTTALTACGGMINDMWDLTEKECTQCHIL